MSPLTSKYRPMYSRMPNNDLPLDKSHRSSSDEFAWSADKNVVVNYHRAHGHQPIFGDRITFWYEKISDIPENWVEKEMIFQKLFSRKSPFWPNEFRMLTAKHTQSHSRPFDTSITMQWANDSIHSSTHGRTSDASRIRTNRAVNHSPCVHHAGERQPLRHIAVKHRACSMRLSPLLSKRIYVYIYNIQINGLL